MLFKNRITRLFQLPRIFLYKLLSTAIVTGRPCLNQPVLMLGEGRIEIADNVQFGYFPSPKYFSTYCHVEARTKSARIHIATDTHINNGFTVCAQYTSVSIGHRCFIGTNVEIYDSDFHGLRVEDRKFTRPEWAKPVVIGDDVFIGSNARILKGVTIGDGAVIGNSALITKDVPSNALVAGNPAKLIRMLK